MSQTLTACILLLAKSKAKMAELPPVFLMWVLIENANILEHDKKLVLSGVNLDKSPEIYGATKKSLLKYCGNDSSPLCSARAAVGPFLAPESTFLTRGRGFNNFQGKGYLRRRGYDFDPNRDLPKSDGSHLKLDGKKINPKMTTVNKKKTKHMPLMRMIKFRNRMPLSHTISQTLV